ncbi:MAG: HAD family hydrolase, partial [Lachnospira sp.]|nr:HAD family hydrolase [Lachnospira sp.]
YGEYDIETIKSFVGNGIRKLLERAVPRGVSNPHYEDIYKTFCGHYEKNCHNKTRPYKGILELISVLKRKGCNIAIVSNKNENAVLELNREFFGDYITVAVGQNDTTRKKPAPDTVLKAMEELHAQKADTLYIGDSEVDKMTADNAGIDCVLVSWGFRKREVLEKMKPLFLADTPGQIESLF